MDTLFLSDLHLSPARPEKLALFRELLRGPARNADAVYILGDLFDEFWTGNDDRTPPCGEVIKELKAFTTSGGRLFLQRGNRDLMMGPDFGYLTGATVLPDLTLVDLDDEPVLIMHGDLLCTRDTSYQLFRATLDFAPVRWTFLHLPATLRTGLAHGLRPAMRRSAAAKAPEIIDVTPNAVERAMRHWQVQTLIHGHTHRPAVHELQLDGKPAKRYVLGDWYGDCRILVCRNGERQLVPAADCLAPGF